MQRRERLARGQARQQADALLKHLAASYTALTAFMEQNPGIVQPVNSDAEHMQQEIYQRLQQNLQRADASPRCCWIKEDGTQCRSPKMRTNHRCFAHMQMYEAQPQKFTLPAAEDANGIQLAIRRVQRALIDDEISEKKAGLLLYSLQIASTNLERTTFGENPEEMVTDFVYLDEQTPAETQKHGEEGKRSGDRVIGTSGNRNIETPGQLGKILPRSETFTTEIGEKPILPRMECQAETASGA
jgi:hypothetical protein